MCIMNFTTVRKTGICRWLFLLISLSTWTKLIESKEMRVVCYYTNWSVYRPGTAKFSPQNINPYLCTHLIYAFGGFTKENTLKPFDKYQDIEKGGYAKFTGLKTYNKNLKTLLAIGGWNEGSSRFSPMVASADRRKELVKNTIKFLRQNHFDGLDLDWEYPTFRDGGKSRDRDNYAQLVKELREEFERESEKTGRSRLLLTMAVPAGIEYVNKGYDVPKLNKYLDWMNILSYDYHSAYEPAVDHHAPLYPLEEDNEYNYDVDLNIDHTIKHYMKMGADPSKLVLGIPTYGRSYTLYNSDATDIGSPADGPGDMGEATRENGYLAYYEICENIRDQDWEVEQPNPEAMGPYAYKDNQWVGYDDEAIVRKKAQYVAENSLGGIMFWAIDNDDFRGNCHGKPYPLIEAGKEALLSAYGIIEENLISPPAKPIKSKTKNRTRTKLIEKEEKELSTSTTVATTRRRRIKTKQQTTEDKVPENTTKRRKTSSRKQQSEATSTYSSLKIVTPSYTTPVPPATPDVGGAFKCEDEGFFPHPKDCKKYYWCLSGAGDSEIVAHQFTCPAGLYFNKAADSCDYSQNVLCNKKLQKATTSASSTTEEPSTTKSSFFSTSRVPPKITAATSRTTFKQTTTTPAYEEEYYDEDDEDEPEEDNDSKSDAEEDPQVIKELLDLIKKAGGIEQLEKYLHIDKDDSRSQTAGSETSTKSSRTKTLVERVLAKTSRGTIDALKKNQVVNGRGPQLSLSELKKGTDRGKLQYKTIARQRQSTAKPSENETEDEVIVKEKTTEDKRLFRTKSTPEYVNIRRPRVSTTTEANDSELSRNKILGEESADAEEEDSDETFSREEHKSASTPKYVNIRRERPSTTEEPTTTTKYIEIRRLTTSTTEASNLEKSDENIEELEQKRRGTTTPSSRDDSGSSSKYQTIRRGTTTEANSLDDSQEVQKRTRGTTTPTSRTLIEDTTTLRSSIIRNNTLPAKVDEENDVTSRYQTLSRGTSITESTTAASERNISSPPTESQAIDVKETEESETLVDSSLNITANSNAPNIDNLNEENSNTDNTNNEVIAEKKETNVLLQQPRPFSRTPSTSDADPTSTTSKVSQTNFKFRLRQKATSEITTSEPATTRASTRIRGGSRFTQTSKNIISDSTENKTSTVRARKRPLIVSTTEKYVDYNEEQNRKYRPSELADLSSLTAVDFTKIKGLDQISGKSRRRRPTTVSVTSTTTESLDESLKTGSRTLPLARKLLDPTTFGKSRRVIVKNDDQAKSASELTASTAIPKRGRGLRTTTQSSVTESIDKSAINKSRTRVIKRFRAKSSTTTTTPKVEEEEEVKANKTTIRPLFRSFRPKQNDLIESNKDNNPLQKLFNKKPTRLPFDVKNNDTSEETTEVNDASEEDTEEDENIKLSESNIRESSDLNSYDLDPKQRRQFLKYQRNFESFVDKDIDDRDTNPSINARPNILRKSSVTETTTTSTPKITTEPLNRKRKIIRKFRPTNSVTESTDKSNNKLAINKNLYIRGRPTTTTTELPKSTTEDTSLELETEEIYKLSYTSHRTNEDSSSFATTESYLINPESETTEFDSYSTFEDEFGTKSSTPESSSNNFEPDHESEDEDTPNYTSILRSTSINRSHHFESNINFDNENEEELDEVVKDKDSVVSSMVNSMLHSKNETETFVNEEENNENNEMTVGPIIEPQETSTKRNPLLRPQKERPSFSRQKFVIDKTETRSETQKGLSPNVTRYRTSTRSSTLSPPASSVESTTAENQVSKFNRYKYSKISRISSTTPLSTTPGFTTTSKSIQFDIYTTPEDIITSSTESDNLLTTEDLDNQTVADTTEISNEIFNTDTTEDTYTSLTTNDDEAYISTGVESMSDTSTVESNTETTSEAVIDETTVSDELISVVSTTEIEQLNASSTTTIGTTDYSATTENSLEISSSPTTENNLEISSSTRKSAFRPIQTRPKFNLLRNAKKTGTTSTTEAASSESTRKFYRTRDKFSRNKLQQKSTTAETPTKSSTVNRFIYNRFSTTEKPKYRFQSITERIETFKESFVQDSEEDIDNKEEDMKSTQPSFIPRSRFGQQQKANKPVSNGIISTTTQAATEIQLDIVDTEAVKQRNKHLFSQRKMNTPYVPITQTTPNIDTAQNQTDSTTDSTMTTLHHIFAEVKNTAIEPSSTESLLTTHKLANKAERIIEVNRIVEVNAKEAKIKNHTKIEDKRIVVETIPTLDKIGEISRVVNIKIVDGNETNTKSDSRNETANLPAKVVEIPASEIMKIINLTDISFKINMTNLKTRDERKYPSEDPIIDGKSNVNLVTPKPFYHSETSTIALQGLFQGDETSTNTNIVNNFHANDEILETGRSEYVNVRILNQDDEMNQERSLKDEQENRVFVPLRILKQDEHIAHVVEVKPQPEARSIKIVPIKVEMPKRVPLPLYRVQNVDNQ